MKLLVTGGAGFIGSHTVVELLEAGHQVVIADSLVNSDVEVLNRIESITGQKPKFHKVDLCDEAATHRIFDGNQIEAVIHFAGLKAVGESVEQPLRYYQNNLGSTINLLRAMKKHQIYKLVFSSSATVYGDSQASPIKESEPANRATNPYGWTKVMIEQMLFDEAASGAPWQIAILRYFNPIGAHPSGFIGEDPQGTPNNLMPYVAQVAVGIRKELAIFGDDYDTVDGTGVRDYIHVTDLAKGHIVAISNLPNPGQAQAYNLGTGQGVSVLDLVKAFEQASKKSINYKIANRRAGDVAELFADVSKAKQDLGWSAQKSLLEACQDSWNWQSKNPKGY